MRLLVQRRGELDSAKAVDFIDGCPKAKVALVHASLKDEVALLDFLQYLVDNLKTPFAGMRVSGSATNEGYYEDAVAIAVLCGDFEVNVLHEKINLQNPEKTAEKITPKLDEYDLCLVHSANNYKQNVMIDGILRRIQNNHPRLQIIGGASSPPAIVAAKEGIYNDHITLTAIKGQKTELKIYSPCRIDEASQDEFVITKADEYNIYEINGRDAVEEYSKIQHIRPYFLNMITNYILNRSDILKVVKALANASGTLREGLLSLGINLIGAKNRENIVEAALILELNEEGRRYVRIQNYKPEGTTLKRVKHTIEEGTKAFDQLAEYSEDKNSMLIIACAAIFWIYADLDNIKEKLKKIKPAFLFSFVFGEFGATLPYQGLEQNVVHGAMVKALASK
ncbi:MAG: hypothetical protein JW778_04615 [Candidatus Altiarchaeota archaeon]|nr:hypothetical protein [Candidatus Altiarchaeota archaeon]